MRQVQDLKAEARNGTGKGPSYQTRQKGFVPAVVYGGKNQPENLSVERHTLERQVDVLMQEGVGLSAATQHVPMPEWRHWAQYDTWHARNVQRQYLAAELRWLGEAASAPSAALKR